jgi:8-oxo-dGTP pyrophosphatase MutT (NUDIX family)
MNDLPALLKSRLTKPLPGEMAQYLMAPRYRTRGSFRDIDVSSYRISAVMILLCARNEGQWFIPLTLRHDYEGVHSSQISLPGGKKEEGDSSLADTALRECYEEIGIQGTVEILGALSPLHIPVSRYIVHPFIGINAQHLITYQSHEREVKAIIELPLNVLLDKNTQQSGTITVGENRTIEAPYFFVEGHKVWGATAMILSELKGLLEELA